MTDSLKAYVEHAQDIMEQAPQMGETNTKEMLIRRFIEVLGWAFHPSEITLEYPVRIASRRTKVDYALLIDGTQRQRGWTPPSPTTIASSLPAICITKKGLNGGC